MPHICVAGLLANKGHQMTKLLGQPASINVRKVLWTCHELGLTPTCEDWGGPARATASPEFRSINPKSLVPVWIEDGWSAHRCHR